MTDNGHDLLVSLVLGSFGPSVAVLQYCNIVFFVFFDIMTREKGSRGTSQGARGGLNYSRRSPLSAGRSALSLQRGRLKMLLIFVSFFDRFEVGLGSVLGVVFGPFAALVGPSWSQSPLRTDISSKNMTLDLARW